MLLVNNSDKNLSKKAQLSNFTSVALNNSDSFDLFRLLLMNFSVDEVLFVFC